jgi:hypothetical protein
MYADDAAVVGTSAVGLQRMLWELEKYCDEWRLRVNVKRTKVTVFRKGGKFRKGEGWRYQWKKLEVVSRFKYLGTHFASSGKWLQHTGQAIRAAKFSSVLLSKFYFRNRDCDLTFFVYLFDHTSLTVWG